MPKVLVVEDDLQVMAMIRQHLQLEGFSVVEASDAKEAWQLLLEERPDAALIDLNLRTEREGWARVATVREDGRFARLPTVVMTGVEEPHLADRAEELGSGFLSKPFSGAEVVEGLRQAMKRALNTSRVVLHLAALRIEGTVHLPAGRFSPPARISSPIGHSQGGGGCLPRSKQYAGSTNWPRSDWAWSSRSGRRWPPRPARSTSSFGSPRTMEGSACSRDGVSSTTTPEVPTRAGSGSTRTSAWTRSGRLRC